VGNLGGGNHHNTACVLIGVTAVILNMTVLHGGGIVPALHADQTFLLTSCLIVAVPDGGMLQDISGIVVVDLRCTRLHGLLHIQHEGQFLILNL
jgi:hypothetical protein